MYAAKDIAAKFVAKGIGDGKPVTQMQLQKLVYFAHGVHLANDQGPLITERIEAWKFGPVIPVLYDIYRFYGSDKITDTHCASLFLGKEAVDPVEFIELSNSAQNVIDLTWETLKDISAIKLSGWTHIEGSPWSQTFRHGANVVISNDLIKAYFEEHVVEKDA